MASARRLVNLQVLRFVAAVLVVHAHAVDVALGIGATPRLLAAGALENFGAVGVDIFFVISGLIITRTAFQATPVAASTFAWKRLWRVAPIYYLLSLPWIVMAAAAGTLDVPMLVASVAFWPAAGPRPVMPALEVGWTLCFEMLFYGVVTAVLALTPVLRRRGAVALALAVFAACWFVRSRTALPAFQILGNPIVLEFLMGVGAALLAPRMSPRAGAWAALIGLSGVAATLWLGYGAVSDAMLVLYGRASLWRAIIWGTPCALLVLGVVALDRAETPTPLLSRLAKMGDASYALYLVHPLVMIIVGQILSRTGWRPPGDLLVLGGIAASVAASLAVHRWIERPIQTWRPGPNPRQAPIAL